MVSQSVGGVIRQEVKEGLMQDMQKEIEGIKSDTLGAIDKTMVKTAQDEIRKFNHAIQIREIT